MEARRSGEHVRTWWQNLTHTAGGGSGGVGCFSLAPAVGPGAGGSWRGPRTQSDVVVGQSARPRGPCASAPAAGVGWGVACGDSQAATSCPSRDWWAEEGPSSVPPRGGAPAGAAVGVGSWTRSRLVGTGPDTCWVAGGGASLAPACRAVPLRSSRRRDPVLVGPRMLVTWGPANIPRWIPNPVTGLT